MEGDFEISKEETIEQSNNINNNKIKNHDTKADSKIYELNWTEQIKKKQKETKRIPIIVQSQNTFFGQNEIIKNQPKRQTRAICQSLNGALFLISKNILLHHLNNWNGLEELKSADKVINNWSYQRLSQIVEFQKIPTNKFDDLIKGTKMKKKKSQSKGQERLSISQNTQQVQKQEEGFISKEELLLLSPKKQTQRQSRLSVISQQGILATFNKQTAQAKKKNSILEINTNKVSDDIKQYDNSNSFNNTHDFLGVFSNDVQESRKSIRKSQFQFLIPSLSLPQQNMMKQFENQETQNHQALNKSNSIVNQQTECLSPTNFSKFKKFHDKRITTQLLELLEDQKKVDRRKKDSAQMSQSRLSDKDKNRVSMDEIQRSQTMFEQQTNTPKKNQRTSLFFPNQVISGVSTIPSQQITESQTQISTERKSFTKNSNTDQLQKSFTQFNINPSSQNENNNSNNKQNSKKSLLIQDFYENADLTIQSSRNKQHSFQDSTKMSQTNFTFPKKQDKGKNKNPPLIIMKRNSIKFLDKQQKSPTQQESKPEEKKIQYGIYNDYYHKQIPSMSQRLSRTVSNEKKLSVSQHSSQRTVDSSFIQQDQIIENDQDSVIQTEDKDQIIIQQGNLKEISKIRKAQLLEKIKTNLYYSQPAQKSINSEDRKLDELDSKVFQLKELMDVSPRIIFQNINNVHNFKKRFLKILSSQPAILQKKLFDFRSHSEKYLYRKLKSNQKLAINQLFSQMTPQLQQQQTQRSANSNEDQIDMTQEPIPQEEEKVTNKLLQDILKKLSSRENNFFQPIKPMNKMSRQDPFIENGQNYTKRSELSLQKNQSSKHSQNNEKVFSQPNSPLGQQQFDMIRKFMDKSILKEGYSVSTHLEKSKQENDSISFLSTKNADSQLKKTSFFLSPRYSLADDKKSNNMNNNSLPLLTKFNESSLSNYSYTNSSQANNTTINTKISNNKISSSANNQNINNQQTKILEISYDFTLQPESGYIQKLNILSSRNQNRKNVIKKNFTNTCTSTPQQYDCIEQGTNLEQNSKQIETKPKLYLYKLNPIQQKSQETQIDSNLIDSLPSPNIKTNRLSELLCKNQQQKVSNINFSTNQETGQIQEKQYIKTFLNKRKPIQQRIKEQQIKQKGIQSVNTSNYFHKPFQQNSKQFIEDQQSPKALDTIPKGTTAFNSCSFSGFSDIHQNEKVYQFQSVSPKKVFKKNS